MGASVSNKQQGFSLLEVLVAFVVMGLVVGTLLQLMGTSVRGVAISSELSFAIQLAESRLATVGTEIEVEQGEVSGEVEHTPYSWRVVMEPIELIEQADSFSLSTQAFKVDVIIEWSEGAKKRDFSLSSIRFGKKL